MKYVKYIIIGLVILLAGIVVGRVYFSKTQIFAGASPVGSTFSSKKIAAIVMAPATSAATSSSILNSTGNDQYISSIEAGCEKVASSNTYLTGGGLSALSLTIGTSSTASQPASVNAVGQGALTISTSSPYFTVSSSTAVMPGNPLVNSIWAAGSYLNFTFNATNTAVCTVGVSVLSS